MKTYGIWMETYSRFSYVVDTKTQMCFAGAISVIPCERLYMREEWRAILTWVKPEPTK